MKPLFLRGVRGVRGGWLIGHNANPRDLKFGPIPDSLGKKNDYKVGPLPVISRVITPLIGVITPVTHL